MACQFTRFPSGLANLQLKLAAAFRLFANCVLRLTFGTNKQNGLPAIFRDKVRHKTYGLAKEPLDVHLFAQLR